MAQSVERQRVALQALQAPGMTLADLTATFLAAPLHRRERKSPTIYTAVYRPAESRVDYVWPGKRWTQCMAHFEPGEYTHDFGELIA